MTSPIWCWAFEAGSIQAFIFETGRLADAVGASLLVDRLTGDLGEEEVSGSQSLLGVVLQAAGATKQIGFSRRGGGAFIAFCGDEALLRRTRALWHAALRANAPGLRWGDGIACAASELRAAQAALAACQVAGRQELPRRPEAGPLVLRVARTGQPAVERAFLGAKGIEAVDASTRARRRHGRHNGGLAVLTDRFSAGAKIAWPRNMDADDETEGDPRSDRFPFVGAERDVAFVHADGNGLGVLLRKLETVPETQYRSGYATFSLAIARAMRRAAAQATAAVLLPAARPNDDGSRTMPARPLVLGGDDLTLVVRAELAMPFAVAYLRAFELFTAEELKAVSLNDLPMGGLTAACGVLVVKATYPFAMAAELAEGLCARAKRVIKREERATQRAMPLSALALQRVTTSMADEALPIVCWQGRDRRLGHEAYVLRPAQGPATALPCWEDLEVLAGKFGDDASPRGPARKLLIDLYQDTGSAIERYRRWREQRQEMAGGPQWLGEFDALLLALGVSEGAALPLGDAGTPWPDALLLAELNRLAARAPAPSPEPETAQ